MKSGDHSMNPKEATQIIRMQEWSQIIHDRVQSGQSVSQYCTERGLSKNAYFYWLKKIKCHVLKSAEPTFVEISDQIQSGCQKKEDKNAAFFHSSKVAIQFHGAEIQMDESVSEEFLTKLFRVIRNA